MTNYCKIEIDCQPGYPRPNDVLTWVFDNVSSTINNLNENQKSTLNHWKTLIPSGGGKFGHFIWELPYDLDEKYYEYLKDQIWLELVKYYNNRTLRYSCISKIVN